MDAAIRKPADLDHTARVIVATDARPITPPEAGPKVAPPGKPSGKSRALAVARKLSTSRRIH
eukprot:5650664-Lingulodinium_polyedra.AAC.1